MSMRNSGGETRGREEGYIYYHWYSLKSSYTMKEAKKGRAREEKTRGERDGGREDPLIRVPPVLLIYSASVIQDRSFSARDPGL